MKYPFTALLLASALLTSAHAKDFKLPEKGAVINFSFPDKWTSEKYDDGVESLSKDETIYLCMQNIDTQNVSKSIDEAIAYLKEKGVTPDDATIKKTEAKHHGMDVISLAWQGTDKDGPCKISEAVIAATADKGAMLIYWGSAEGEKKNMDDLNAILESIKPVTPIKEEASGEEEKADKPEKSEKAKKAVKEEGES